MEIGSEFWLETSNNNKIYENFWELGKDRKFLLSGRTAIAYILDEIAISRKISKVYFPNYCCYSMIEPFIKRDIDIIFYSIEVENKIKYKIDENEQCDIFFAMNYFGYVDSNMDYYIKKFKEKGCIIIEDSTHSLLSNRIFSQDSDYIIASLRKWFPVMSGGIAINNSQTFKNEIYNEQTNEKMIELRRNAMLMKRRYINGENIDKTKFLELYKTSNKQLSENYENIVIDNMSNEILMCLDIQKIKDKRKNNAKIIYEQLNRKQIKFLFESLEDGDCPLFIPIILKDEKTRDKLRDYLIQQKIYCPVHWPIPEILQNKESNIYDKELSLICDHRYDEEDIRNYIQIINKFFE